MTNHPNRSKRGRPPLDPNDRKVRVNVMLSPAALAILDKSPDGRSAEIERLILASAEQRPTR